MGWRRQWLGLPEGLILAEAPEYREHIAAIGVNGRDYTSECVMYDVNHGWIELRDGTRIRGEVSVIWKSLPDGYEWT